MGADLYIQSIYKENEAKWNPKFRDAVARRDAATEEGNQTLADEIQKEVMECYEQMNAIGYFRDSYNTSSILWLLGLSWWENIGAMLNKRNFLSVTKAKKLKKMIAEKEVPEITREWLEENGYGEEQDIAQVNKYYKDAKDELLAFLDKAIEMKEAIYCSI